MKAIRLYWLSSLLIIASLFLANKALQTKKNVELLRSQIVSRQQTVPADGQNKLPKITDADLITARQLIEALAISQNLPLSVNLDRGVITIVPTAFDKKQAAETEQSKNTYAGSEVEGGETDGKEAIEQAKFEVLKNYDGILAFLGSVASLPYQLKYKELCIGLDCNSGFEAAIEIAKQG